MTTVHLVKSVEDVSKTELCEVMNYLQSKVDSGRHTGAEVQILRKALEIYMSKYETK